MIAPTPFFADRGCHKRIYEEARELQHRGHQVIICTYHLGRDMEGIQTERIINIPWYKKLEAGPSWHKFYLDLLLFLKALRVSLREKPDIFHGHLHEGALIAKILGWIFRRPMVFDAQGSLVAELQDHGFISEKGVLFRFFLWLEKLVYRLSDRIIISSHQAHRLIRKKFALPEEKALPIVDGVNLDTFKSAYSFKGLKKKWKLPLRKKIVIYVGILNHYQGAEYIIASLKHLLAMRKDVHFLIIGFPQQPYQKLAEEEGLKNYLTFTGRIPYTEVPRYYCLAQVAISPKLSISEANGKLLEYMAMGLPSVVFDSQVSREILGELGFYAKMRDAFSFAQQIDSALRLQEENGDLKERLRKRAEELFSWESRVKEILSIYHSLNK